MILSAIFAEKLKRLDLLKIPDTNFEQHIRIAVYRNHSFELIAGVLNKFFNFSKMSADFIYSDYDDSFNFQFQNADLQIIWVDANRYKTNNITTFLEERATVLRSYTKSPILIVYVGDTSIKMSKNIPDCICVSVNEILCDMGDTMYDYAKEAFSGTCLSDKASLEMARYLGLKCIPAILKPALKAIVLDLDNTLYAGVLGEDGITNLIPNNNLQQQLKDLKERGFMLCIASKNEESDVKQMFQQRTDFVLQWSDFTTTQINWNQKAENLLKIAKQLNIGIDAMLFVDDNPAEIQNVEATGVNTILATDNVCTILKYYPGLLKFNVSDEDLLRSKDIQANAERTAMIQTLSPKEYFEKLGIKLEYNINNVNQIPRIVELLGKTNQFILSYARCKETTIQEFMLQPDKCVITIHMSDNLSDSGIIAIFVAHNESDALVVDELTVSCRALGRNLENVMLPYLFVLAQEYLNTKQTAHIKYQHGERNMPAMNWLTNLVNLQLDDKGIAEYKIPDSIDLSGLEVAVCKN